MPKARRAFSGLAALAAIALAGMADMGGSAAQGQTLRRLDTGNDSRGWEAVGRLELGGKGFCTGAMIEPHLVLTAAHCLWDKATGRPVETAEIEFRAGWRNGRAAAYRKVRRAVWHPNYLFDGSESLAQVPHDLAILVLDSPIRLPAIRPFSVGDAPRKGDQVGIVSYARHRAEAPSLQDSCHVLSNLDKVAVLSCDVDFGSSGSPVFSFEDGEPKVVSVITAKAEMSGEKVSLGLDMSEALEVLKDELSRGAQARKPVKRPQVGDPDSQLSNTSTGAKFLRIGPTN